MSKITTAPYQYTESLGVRDFFENYGEKLLLRLVTSDKTLSRSTIRERSVNRPALAVTGYFKYFPKRIQLFGAGEMAFFRSNLPGRTSVMDAAAENTLRGRVPKRPTPEMIESSIEDSSLSNLSTAKAFTTEVTVMLEGVCPWSTYHGTLLDIRESAL